MKSWKKMFATGLIASVALLGAACGDDADTGTDTGTDTGVTEPAGTEPAGDLGGTGTMSPTEGGS